MPKNTVEIRVTRPDRYPLELRQNLQAHQGHYFQAPTQAEAEAKAREQFPNETLTYTLFKQWDSEGRLVDI